MSEISNIVMKKLGADKSPFSISTTGSTIDISYKDITKFLAPGDNTVDVITNNGIHLLLKQNKSALKKIEKLESNYQNVNDVLTQSTNDTASFLSSNPEGIKKFNKTTLGLREMAESIKAASGAPVFFKNNNVPKVLFDMFKLKCSQKNLQELTITTNLLSDKSEVDLDCVITMSEFDTMTYTRNIDRYYFQANKSKKYDSSSLLREMMKINYSVIKTLAKSDPAMSKIIEDGVLAKKPLDDIIQEVEGYIYKGKELELVPEPFLTRMLDKDVLGIPRSFGVYRTKGKLSLIK